MKCFAKMCPEREHLFFVSSTQTLVDHGCALMKERQVSISHYYKIINERFMSHSLITQQEMSLSGLKASFLLPEASVRQWDSRFCTIISVPSAPLPPFFQLPQSRERERDAHSSLYSTHPNIKCLSSLLCHFCLQMPLEWSSPVIIWARPKGDLWVADEVNYTSWDPLILLFLIFSLLQTQKALRVLKWQGLLWAECGEGLQALAAPAMCIVQGN